MRRVLTLIGTALVLAVVITYAPLRTSRHCGHRHHLDGPSRAESRARVKLSELREATTAAWLPGLVGRQPPGGPGRPRGAALAGLKVLKRPSSESRLAGMVVYSPIFCSRHTPGVVLGAVADSAPRGLSGSPASPPLPPRGTGRGLRPSQFWAYSKPRSRTVCSGVMPVSCSRRASRDPQRWIWPMIRVTAP